MTVTANLSIEDHVAGLLSRAGHSSGAELIGLAAEALRGRIAVTSSFGAESAVLLALVAQVDRSLPVIFLDTGELFDETLAYRDLLIRRLGLLDVRTVAPTPEDRAAAEELWRTDADCCCHLRKVLPLQRVAGRFSALIDGRKRAHGGERSDLRPLEVVDRLVRVSPLWSWSSGDIEDAFKELQLPAHPLVALGYRSIGCWPCTRPVGPDEPIRAGRWADSAKTECGIHLPKEEKLRP